MSIEPGPPTDETRLRAEVASAREAGAAALPRLEAIEAEFGTRTEPQLLPLVLDARIARGAVLGAQGRVEDGLCLIDEVLAACASQAVPSRAAAATFTRAELLERAGRPAETVEVLRELVRRSEGAADEPTVAAVMQAQLWLGTLAAQSGDVDAALAQFDDVIAGHAAASDAAAQRRTATALCNKATAYMQQRRDDEALAACEEALRLIGDRSELSLVRVACRVLSRQSAILGLLGRDEDALAVGDDLIRRADALRDAADPELLFTCAQARFGRAVRHVEQDRHEEALSDLESVLADVGESERTGYELLVAHALACQADAHGRLGAADAALEALQQVETRFGSRGDVRFAEQTGRALLGRAHILHSIGREEEAAAAIEAVQERFADREEPPLVELRRVARALWKRPEWRDHPHLEGRFHPDDPDDLQVIVHDGGPRITQARPESIWVRVSAMEGDLFRGIVLNKPHQLETVQLASEIWFLVAPGAPFPIMVTQKYLKERDAWEVLACDGCGLTELFDAPSDLFAATFPDLPAGTRLEMFTALCPLCGGAQVVKPRGEGPSSSGGDARKSPEPARPRKKPWWRFGF